MFSVIRECSAHNINYTENPILGTSHSNPVVLNHLYSTSETKANKSVMCNAGISDSVACIVCRMTGEVL